MCVKSLSSKQARLCETQGGSSKVGGEAGSQRERALGWVGGAASQLCPGWLVGAGQEPYPPWDSGVKGVDSHLSLQGDGLGQMQGKDFGYVTVVLSGDQQAS